MKHYRIIKYNLENDLSFDWSSFSDIGKIFNGERLSYDSYIDIENLYIELINLLINNRVKTTFSIKGLYPYYTFSEIEKNIGFESKIVFSRVLEKIKDSEAVVDINLNNIGNNIINHYIKEFTYIGFDIFDLERNVQIQYKDEFMFNTKCLRDISRLLIRELIPCSKINLGKSYIHFGYDMYLYIYCPNGVITADIIKSYKKKGIYIEEGIKSSLK
ncbi:hypothetical protein CSA08_04665 [Candidatus Gracilibacteria bacterium]|nr:MAG: hypothetical protein CSA08_04665 [Candidatus Gracilibacteria bacterium]